MLSFLKGGGNLGWVHVVRARDMQVLWKVNVFGQTLNGRLIHHSC